MPSGGVLDQSSSGDNAQLTLEEIKAVVATAHDYGFTVAAHAHGAEAIRRAVIGGVDSIEHGTFMDDQDMKLMKEHGTWYVPTIIAGDFVGPQGRDPGLLPAAGRRQGRRDRAADPRHRRPRLQGGRENRLRHRRGRLSPRRECARVRADGAGGHAADVCPPGGDP
jgi:imidazolonepropionase-like amidohydrolase